LFSVCYGIIMHERRDSDDDLAFDIGYALKRAGLKVDIEQCRTIAARVVKHLRLARWQFRRRTPGPMHGSFKPEE
jgi:hypothetical protein